MSNCRKQKNSLNSIGGKTACIISNIVLLGALVYGGYYIYNKHHCCCAADEEKKQATAGLVEEIPAEPVAEEKPTEEAPATESA